MLLLLVVSGLILSVLFGCNTNQEKFYGFYKSEFGKDYKKFEHNIFGFTMDIPNNWFFGVVGNDIKTGEVLIYPEGLKTQNFSKGYSTISVSNLNFVSIGYSLQQICSNVIRGKKESQNIQIINDCNKEVINNYNSTQFKTVLRSNTGYNIIEEVFVLNEKSEFRSISLRYEESIDRKDLQLLYEMVNTFNIK